ncbi:ribosome small subunit-dependent GTPase A [Paenibacillus psychroresistens]|uniref:Small ribosomal subunit biogenesis GTPase RsgA n=1 Tax=Paenibacillus psychroresistens TaxID=1778678 RepID=A0A6B8RM65_9BACL|nr:ribosome small subunit-dependent GTPase A [Paenibacillus psychroresistens]QGQ96937.1 ribosome small subunit-dependent GTPase A [Paenibacillus psychroresistens]
MAQGMIVKALSGYYYVLPENLVQRGESQAEIGKDHNLIQCRGRGILRKNKTSPLVGDRVIYELTENGEGMVDEIMPRSTELIRPPIANVSLAVLVFSLNEPALNLQLLDKFLVHIEHAGLETLICFTKQDLIMSAEDSSAEFVSETSKVYQLYKSMGYNVLTTSALKQEGIEAVLDRLQGVISVFSGQSGVGKSSLLNAMMPSLQLETNIISHKLGRGKHTTRHVELIPLGNGGWVADTPGFSQLDFLQLEAEELSSCFIEFQALSEGCKFRGCLHQNEPDCRVKDALALGTIAASRYEHYIQFLVEIKERKRRY